MRKVEFKVAAPTKLIIGDPMYLDDIVNGTDKGCEKEITFIRKRLPKDTHVEIVIEEIQETYEDMTFTSIRVKILGVSEKYSKADAMSIMAIFKADKYHPLLVSKQNELGCDTACFIIETNKGYEEFHTGADGYYGSYIVYKGTKAYSIELSLDSDFFDFDNVVSTMKYLFEVQK